jgi:outer membrane protein TolC
MRLGKIHFWLVRWGVTVTAFSGYIVWAGLSSLPASTPIFAPPTSELSLDHSAEIIPFPAVEESYSPATQHVAAQTDLFAPPQAATPSQPEQPYEAGGAGPVEALPQPAVERNQAVTPEVMFAPPFGIDRPSTYSLSLAEAIRVGLQQSKEVIVLGYAPSVDGTLIQNADAFFDPVRGAAAYGGRSDVQVRSLIQSFGSTSDFLDTNFLQPFNQPNNLYLRRNLVSGGQAELGFSTDYEDYFPPGDQLIVNPGWDSALNFRFDQPLMKGLGSASTLAPLKIAQAKYKESRFTFMAQVRELARDIEFAYWEFASAERSYQVARQLLNQVQTLLDEETQRVDLGQSALPNMLQVKSLYEEFRVLEMESAKVRDIAESQLRQIMGVDMWTPGESAQPELLNLSGLPLAAADEGEKDSALEPIEEMLPFALQRPEILAQRAVITAAQADLLRARNDLRPDLSARVDYSVTGLDQNLGQSIRTIARHEYNTWAVGLIYERPFGLRSAKADCERAELTISQEIARLNQIEYDISSALRRAEDKLKSEEEILAGQIRRVEVAQEQLSAYSALYQEGRADIFLLVESERTLAAAKLQMVESWRDRQMAVAERNFQANNTSSVFEFASDDPDSEE